MNIKELLQNIENGKRYELKTYYNLDIELYNNDEHRYLVHIPNLYGVTSYGNKYIEWNHYGTSTCKMTLKDLEWILKVIFKGATPNDFIEI